MQSTGLKSQSTFENLKIDSGDLAVMAAKAITQEKFARMYNPLFIHGGELLKKYMTKSIKSMPTNYSFWKWNFLNTEKLTLIIKPLWH